MVHYAFSERATVAGDIFIHYYPRVTSPRFFIGVTHPGLLIFDPFRVMSLYIIPGFFG